MRYVKVRASCTFLEMLLYLEIKGRDWHVSCMRKWGIGKFLGILENLGTDRCRRIVVQGGENVEMDLILVGCRLDSVAEGGML